MSRYDMIAASHDAGLELVAGSADDRLAGLGPLLAEAKDASILDVACHNGLNAAAFAEAGARSVDGFDFWRPGVEQAQNTFRAYAIPARFAVCDLRQGLEGVRANLAPLPDRYDIVLYLGIHHHLLRQIDKPVVEALLGDFAGMAERYVAVRTPAHSMESAAGAVTQAGFELWYEDYENKAVGGLKVFKRR